MLQPSLDLRYLQLPHPRSARADEHLSPFEEGELAQNPRHRNGWLAARWMIKRLLCPHVRTPEGPARDCDVSVLSRSDDGQPQRPVLLLQSNVLSLDVSISRTAQGVLVALAHQPGIQIGVDLTPVDRRFQRGIGMGFTPSEREWLEDREPSAAAQVWAIKQAFYKATNRGEPFRPRRYEVRVDTDGDYVCYATGQRTHRKTQVVTTECDDQMAALVVQLPVDSQEIRITHH